MWGTREAERRLSGYHITFMGQTQPEFVRVILREIMWLTGGMLGYLNQLQGILMGKTCSGECYTLGDLI